MENIFNTEPQVLQKTLSSNQVLPDFTYFVHFLRLDFVMLYYESSNKIILLETFLLFSSLTVFAMFEVQGKTAKTYHPPMFKRRFPVSMFK